LAATGGALGRGETGEGRRESWQRPILPAPISPLPSSASAVCSRCGILHPANRSRIQFLARDRSLHGATSRLDLNRLGHAKSFRLCALRSLGRSMLAPTCDARSRRTSWTPGRKICRTMPQLAEPKQLMVHRNCRPQARIAKSRGENRRAKSCLGKHFGAAPGVRAEQSPPSWVRTASKKSRSRKVLAQKGMTP
jgi:hypothetical protein